LLGSRPIPFDTTQSHLISDQNQTQVFRQLVDLEPLLGGIHTTIFAYGVTGSGKTHTMLGDSWEDGLAQRTVKALFDEMGRRQGRWGAGKG
jgi:hypothetical protein